MIVKLPLKLLIKYPQRIWNSFFFKRTNYQIYHFSFHKNLTVYYSRIAHRFAIKTGRNFKHFNSKLDEFSTQIGDYNITSLNNHYYCTKHLPENSRLSVFIRDPRDLIISGYYYHKRGAEKWCRVKNPSEDDFNIVNGLVPSRILSNESLSDLYNRLSLEDGIRSEIELRKKHFQTMEKWLDDPDVLILKYENILYNEEKNFKKLADHYSFNLEEKNIWTSIAEDLSILKIKNHKHVRNPKINQYKTKFPQNVLNEFSEQYGTLLLKYKKYNNDKS